MEEQAYSVDDCDDGRQAGEPTPATRDCRDESWNVEQRKKLDCNNAKADGGARREGSMTIYKEQCKNQQNGDHDIVLSIDGDKLNADRTGEV
jgi:hypothetical protein